MARILIGNIKGPKGDTGLQGIQGEIGPVGPQGPLPTLVNNALATTPGVAALDAAMGKTLQDHIDTTNSNLTTVRATYPNNHSTTNIVVVRSGNVRILSFSGFPDFTTGSGVFCVLNSIDFPKETVNQEICVRKSNDEWITLTINTTGYVNYECKTAISTSLGMWFNLSYIV